MTENKQFTVVFNGFNYNLKNNENYEELRLTDEKVVYDYIADLLNYKNEEIRKLEVENMALSEEIETLHEQLAHDAGLDVFSELKEY